MIDLHSHLLPGIDDGPATVTEALDMARVAVREGITTMVCTPHIAPQRYPNRPRAIVAAFQAFRTELERAEIPLRVLPGAEIAVDGLDGLTDEDLRSVSIGGGGRWVLLELPFRGWPLSLPRILDGLELRGFRVVLAHPERSESVQTHPDRMRDLVGRGALVQVTAGSFTGDHGPAAMRAAVHLLRNGMAHILSSDAHSATRRPPAITPGLTAAAQSLRVEPEALRWMVEEGPRLITEGEVVRVPRLGVAPPRREARPVPPPTPRAAPARRGR